MMKLQPGTYRYDVCCKDGLCHIFNEDKSEVLFEHEDLAKIFDIFNSNSAVDLGFASFAYKVYSEDTILYRVTHKGSSETRIGLYDNLVDAKEAAEKHAVRNGRLKGKYTITKGKRTGISFAVEFNICSDNNNWTTGIKHGKTIEWEDVA